MQGTTVDKNREQEAALRVDEAINRTSNQKADQSGAKFNMLALGLELLFKPKFLTLFLFSFLSRSTTIHGSSHLHVVLLRTTVVAETSQPISPPTFCSRK